MIDYTSKAQKGQTLGIEIFENPSKMYNNTVKCMSDSILALINEDRVLKLIDEFMNINNRNLLKTLRSVSFFEGWPNIALTQIIKATKLIETRTNQVIYEIDDPIEHVYIVQKGQVAISTNENKFNRKE